MIRLRARHQVEGELQRVLVAGSARVFSNHSRLVCAAFWSLTHVDPAGLLVGRERAPARRRCRAASKARRPARSRPPSRAWCRSRSRSARCGRRRRAARRCRGASRLAAHRSGSGARSSGSSSSAVAVEVRREEPLAEGDRLLLARLGRGRRAATRPRGTRRSRCRARPRTGRRGPGTGRARSAGR